MTRSSDMDDLTFEIRNPPSGKELEILGQGLTEHAREYVETPGFRRIAIFSSGAESHIVAGISGSVNWTWLSIGLLWVHPDLRGRGLGAKLLRDFEALGVEHGCERAHVETFSFQADKFYLRQGYTVYSVLDDYPPGYQRLHMKKVRMSLGPCIESSSPSSGPTRRVPGTTATVASSLPTPRVSPASA